MPEQLHPEGPGKTRWECVGTPLGKEQREPRHAPGISGMWAGPGALHRAPTFRTLSCNGQQGNPLNAMLHAYPMATRPYFWEKTSRASPQDPCTASWVLGDAYRRHISMRQEHGTHSWFIRRNLRTTKL